jgi:signal transduction histidine kinase
VWLLLAGFLLLSGSFIVIAPLLGWPLLAQETQLVVLLILLLLAFFSVVYSALVSNKARNKNLSQVNQLQQLNAALNSQLNCHQLALANASYELRHPVEGIVSFANAILPKLSDNAVNLEAENALSWIASSGRRLALQIDQLVDQAVIAKNPIAIQTMATDLKAAVSYVVALSQPLLLDKPVTIIDQIPVNVPYLEANERRLEQVLWIILSQAIATTSAGEIVISYYAQGNILIVSVLDTGDGLSEAQLGQLKLALQKEDGTELIGQPHYELWLAKQLLGGMSGGIKISSDLGQGTCMTFSLPIAKKQYPKKSPEQPRLLPILQAGVLTEKRQGPSAEIHEGVVLLLDGNITHRKSIQALFRANGYVTLEASSIELAEKIFQQQAVSAVVLCADSIREPVDRVSALRQQFSLEVLPIVVLTTNIDVSNLRDFYEAGANAYVIEPYYQEALLAQVALWVANSVRQGASVDLIRRQLKKQMQTLQAVVAKLQFHPDEKLLAVLGRSMLKSTEPEVEHFDMVTFLQDAVVMFNAILPKQHQLVFESLGEVDVKQNRSALCFILDELVMNASMHGVALREKASIYLSCELHSGEVILKVKNHGEAMSGVMGEGLKSVNTVVQESLGGRFDVQSESGLGVAAIVRFPAFI